MHYLQITYAHLRTITVCVQSQSCVMMHLFTAVLENTEDKSYIILETRKIFYLIIQITKVSVIASENVINHKYVLQRK